jgi:release factor glutamine methyltransferase
MTIREALERAAATARQKASDATAWDARVLLAHAVGRGGPLSLDLRQEVDPEAAARFEALWARRVAGVPAQHLLGEWDFFGRPFSIDGRALIPRPETEGLVAAALAEASGARRVLDAGTGSGILGITWLLERPDARAVALDISLAALALARANARRHGVAERLSLFAGDWLSALSGSRFELILANPPYLSATEEPHLSATVRDHEPRRALYAGSDGLEAIRHLLDALPRFLVPAGYFIFELGFGQADAVAREIRSRPAWEFVRIDPDLAAIPRVAVARARSIAA